LTVGSDPTIWPSTGAAGPATGGAATGETSEKSFWLEADASGAAAHFCIMPARGRRQRRTMPGPEAGLEGLAKKAVDGWFRPSHMAATAAADRSDPDWRSGSKFSKKLLKRST
jgi:hypothetical protein